MQRRLGEIALLLGAITAIGVGVVVADNFARAQMTEIGRDVIARSLSIADPEDVDVEIGGFSAITQLMFGTVDHVVATVKDLDVGDTTADMHLEIYGLPTNEVEPITRVYAYLELDESQLRSLADTLTNVEVRNIELSPPGIDLLIRTELEGYPAVFTMSVQPTIDRGAIVLVPTNFRIGQHDFSPEELRRVYGVDATAYLSASGYCVENLVPDLVTVSDVRVSGAGVLITFGANQLAVLDLESPAGTCDR